MPERRPWRRAIAGVLFIAIAAAISACESDADIKAAEASADAARTQLEQDRRSGNQARTDADAAQLSAAERDLCYLRLNCWGPRDRGW